MEEKESATITVLRTTDAKKDEIPMQMSQTMNELKDAISSSSKFGPLDRTHQRLFHLGRELKTGSRSLGNVGIGKFRNFTVLLHVKPGATTAKKQQQTSTKKAKAASTSKRQKARAAAARQNKKKENNNVVVELLDDESSDDDSIEVIENPQPPKRQRQQR